MDPTRVRFGIDETNSLIKEKEEESDQANQWIIGGITFSALISVIYNALVHKTRSKQTSIRNSKDPRLYVKPYGPVVGNILLFLWCSHVFSYIDRLIG